MISRWNIETKNYFNNIMKEHYKKYNLRTDQGFYITVDGKRHHLTDCFLAITIRNDYKAKFIKSELDVIFNALAVLKDNQTSSYSKEWC